MKNRTKKVLTVAGILIGVGTLCIGAAFLAGAGRHRDEWNFTLGGARIGMYTGETTERYEEYTETVRALEFDFSAVDVEIRTGETFSISGQIPDRLKSAVTEDGVWEIETDSGLIGIDVGLFQEEGQIVITIPEDAVFDAVEIGIGAGRLEAHSIAADEIEVSVGAGEGIIHDFQAESFAAECAAGKLTLSGRAGKLAQVDCGMGAVVLTLDGGEEAYNCDISCGMGEVQIGEQYRTGGLAAERTIQNGADRTLQIDCGMGSVKVEFEE